MCASQCVAVCSSVLLCVSRFKCVLAQRVYVNVHVAVCCSVLQYVAVCSCVLQCVADVTSVQAQHVH